MIIDYNGGKINNNALLFFYASWSSNCNLHLDALKRINKEYNDLIILRINTSKYVNLKKEFNINKIPTFILYIEDEIKARIDGYKDQYSLINWIKKNRS